MIAVADATALIHLLRIDEERLLELAFEQLIIPDAVVAEIADRADELGRLRTLKCISFEAQDTSLLPLLSPRYAHLDAGETAAIRLTLHLGLKQIVVDDLAARRAAARLGLKPLGLLGILIRLKEQAHLPTARPYADRAIAAGYYVSDALYARFRRIVGE